MNGFKPRLAAAGLLAFAFATGAAAQDIDTRTDDGITGSAMVGEINEGSSSHLSRGYGQSFAAGGSLLDGFSFWLKSHYGLHEPANLRFRAYVMEWNGASPGALIWQSALMSGTTSDTPVEYAFGVGAAVTEGSLYVAFLSPEPGPGSGDQYGRTYNALLFQYADTYEAGSLVNLDSPFGQVGSTDFSAYDWSHTEALDAAFTADFSSPPTNVVPEPITMVLMGSGLVGVAGAARRRRRGEAEPETP